MTPQRSRKLFHLTALAIAIGGSGQALAATRIDLAQSPLRDSAAAAAELRPTQAAIATADGGRKVRYQQFHKGIPVWGETSPVAYFAPGTNAIAGATPSFASGTLVEGIAADLPSPAPRLTRDDAMRLTRQLAAGAGATAANVELEQAQLVIRLNEQGRAQLVYLTSLHIHGAEPTSPHYMIDANTGAVLMSWDGLAHRDAHGPGGNEKLGKYFYGKDYKALDISTNCTYQNDNVTTIDMGNGTASVTTPFTLKNCPAAGIPINELRPSNGAYSPENDGHYYGGVVFNMYRDWYNVRPLKDKLIVRVHYGNNYQNAFWDGQRMTFGDGGSSMYPLVSLGVMAHEVSHGFTQQNSGLIYSKQSGGMNEAFSDMAAQAAEEFMYGKASYLIGGEIVKGGPDKALRYMLNPEQDGKSIGHASKYTDRLNVHYSSGVYNKAFALLATSGGWGARKAFDIFVAANMLYWKANSTFNEGACGVIQAAKDKGYNSADVVNAFNQVGVSCEGSTPQPGTKALTNGTTEANLNIAAAGKQVYTFDVAANAGFLAVRTGGGNGNANLYVKFGSEPQPTATGADASSTGSGNAEHVLLKNPKPGRYYVLVHTPTGANAVSLLAVSR